VFDKVPVSTTRSKAVSRHSCAITALAACIEDWRDFGLAAPLARHNRLIILDARGCGASDKPHDPAAYVRAR
jgi:pimeloyl-ACP methyl ester carboxylesterase